jgi:hypothetical protein
MSETLLPCPFCGELPYIRKGVNGYGHCKTEGCHANRAQIVPFDDPPQVAAWNRRAPTQPGEGLREAIEDGRTLASMFTDASAEARVINRLLSLLVQVHEGGPVGPSAEASRPSRVSEHNCDLDGPAQVLRRYQRHYLLRTYGANGHIDPKSLEVSEALDAVLFAVGK